MKTSEEKYQEFRELGYDHQKARELVFLAEEENQITSNNNQ